MVLNSAHFSDEEISYDIWMSGGDGVAKPAWLIYCILRCVTLTGCIVKGGGGPYYKCLFMLCVDVGKKRNS